jgi:hypothetical protein
LLDLERRGGDHGLGLTPGMPLGQDRRVRGLEVGRQRWLLVRHASRKHIPALS